MDLTTLLHSSDSENNGYIIIGPIAIAWGKITTASISGNAASEVGGSFSFPITFSKSPVCIINPSDMGNVCGEYAFSNSVGVSSSNYYAGHTLGSSGGTMQLKWIAIGSI